MGTRGRASSASLTVTPQIQAVQRPDAPYDLTDEEVDTWRAVVEALPADWFPPETHGLLTSYCRHIVRERRLAQLIQQAEGAEALDIPEYERLLKMLSRESQAIGSLATRMRISQQSSYDRKKSKGPRLMRKPWEAD